MGRQLGKSHGASSYKMKVLALTSLLSCWTVSSSPSPDPHRLYGAYHAYHSPLLCKHSLETTMKELCRLEPEKVCETKTRTYKKLTGYEKGECKEIEVCKPPVWRRRRSAEPEADAWHGYPGYPGYYGYYGYHALPACEKETKEVCRQVPNIEEVSKDVEWCYYKPKKVCEEVEVKVPKVDCGGGEEKAEEAV